MSVTHLPFRIGRARVVAVAAALLAGVAIASAFAQSGSVTYTYDPLGRLSTARYDTGVCILYTYDANGNRLSQTIMISGSGTTGVWGCFAWGQSTW